MQVLIVAVLALALGVLVPTAPAHAQEAGEPTRQMIPVNVVVEGLGDRFGLTGVSWLQARVTTEPGGTRVFGLIDWHGVAMSSVASGDTYRATNNLSFSYQTVQRPPFTFDLATALTEQDGIDYYFEHSAGGHDMALSSPPPARVQFTIHGQVDQFGAIGVTYRDVTIRCDGCRP